MEREVGGGIGMENTCKPMAVLFQCMTKSTTNKKNFFLNELKKKEKKIVVLERCLRVSWTARISNQSIRKKINPEYSLERLLLKLILQYLGHLMGRADSLEKTLMLGKTGGRRRSRQQKMRWLDSITDSKDMNLSKLWEVLKDRRVWYGTVHGVSNSLTQLSD